ncbi:MAG: hypothetical protein ABI824_16035 [Acidobacteriota bacterium]
MIRQIERRLSQLEHRTQIAAKSSIRVVSRCVVGRANLATSKCWRTRCKSGALIELVQLDGGMEGLSDSDLDRFVASFPIEAA